MRQGEISQTPQESFSASAAPRERITLVLVQTPLEQERSHEERPHRTYVRRSLHRRMRTKERARRRKRLLWRIGWSIVGTALLFLVGAGLVEALGTLREFLVRSG